MYWNKETYRNTFLVGQRNGLTPWQQSTQQVTKGILIIDLSILLEICTNTAISLSTSVRQFICLVCPVQCWPCCPWGPRGNWWRSVFKQWFQHCDEIRSVGYENTLGWGPSHLPSAAELQTNGTSVLVIQDSIREPSLKGDRQTKSSYGWHGRGIAMK